MPDPLHAREGIWVPFITGTLGADADAVLIGHSSGAAAALRIAEKHRLRGLVLVAAYDSGAGRQGSPYLALPALLRAHTRPAAPDNRPRPLLHPGPADLGDELEAASGYFSRPFDWGAMKANCGFIAQFAGARDRLVPVAVRRPFSRCAPRAACASGIKRACQRPFSHRPPSFSSPHARRFPLRRAQVQRRVAEHLAPKCQYVEQPGGDHFFEPPFSELVDVVKRNIGL